MSVHIRSILISASLNREIEPQVIASDSFTSAVEPFNPIIVPIICGSFLFVMGMSAHECPLAEMELK